MVGPPQSGATAQSRPGLTLGVRAGHALSQVAEVIDALRAILESAAPLAGGRPELLLVASRLIEDAREALARADCDHTFIDSAHCLKCGWTPT